VPTATVNGIQIAYRDEGEGRPLLLVHAFPLSGAMWERQITSLAHYYRVIAPDLRGFGASQVVPGPTSMDQYADDLAGLLDQLELGTQRVALGGLSMGGYIAFAFLRRYRQRLDALILADTRAAPDTEEGRQLREQNARLAEEQGPGAIADLMLPKLLSPQASDELRAEVRQMIEANDRASIAAALRAMAARPDSTELLATIDMPTAIIVGEEDSVTPPSDAHALYEAISASSLTVIEQAGHLSNLEAHNRFNAAVHALLSDEPPFGGGGSGPW
jgi:pimeloyl-ACP methyl ester carboxylesterase